MMQEQNDCTDKPTRENTNSDIDVAISKTGHITPQDILKTLQRENRYLLFLSAIGVPILMLPFIQFVIFHEKAVQTSIKGLCLIKVCCLFCFLMGLAVVSFLIFRMVRTNKKKARIFSGDFFIRKGTVLDTCSCSVYMSAEEGDGYFIKTDGMPECWVRVGTDVFNACRKGMPCYKPYFSENGEEKLFMIYVGECTFETGKM